MIERIKDDYDFSALVGLLTNKLTKNYRRRCSNPLTVESFWSFCEVDKRTKKATISILN
jgi:hypothetical protein